MDTEIKGLVDWFVARHTLDPALPNQWPFNYQSSTRIRPTDRLLEVKEYSHHPLPSTVEEKRSA